MKNKPKTNFTKIIAWISILSITYVIWSTIFKTIL